MKKLLLAMSICTCVLSSGTSLADEGSHKESADSEHMVAQAILTAHYIDAALKAGMDTAAINAALASVAEQSVISEFWISDEQGNIEFTNTGEASFKFPTDPEADSQAAPFAALLGGAEAIVIQNTQPRDLDGALFKYVGVAGVDQPRIVQVGISASEMTQR